ncbi:hypothetical protein [Winogradskyella sp.]|uniref:hypothetical protein n=1 Tax=Winogradskyella sp. TaxID=1883156 RepID=UPI002610C740|nr:hypothetical protein [Winogradskyella sp.]
MKRTIVLIFFLIACIVKVESQSTTQPYKYIVVPLQYGFLTENDQYRLNTLTRYLLKQEGFEVYFDEGEQLPQDLFKDRCLAMYADVDKVKGGFLKTKLKISFKDCLGKIILESEEGSTKKKDLDVAYKDALQKAFVTLDFSKIETKSRVEDTVTTEQPPVPEIVDIQEEGDLEDDVEIVENIEQSIQLETNEEETDILYAQPMTNGFQLVDTTPKKVMLLLKTAKSNVFIVKGKEAIVYSENGKWIYSETTEKGYNSVTLNIKF